MVQLMYWAAGGPVLLDKNIQPNKTTACHVAIFWPTQNILS
jgi:hypothetical protein